MDAEGLSRAVRRQVGLGRLLPLGDAADGAWLAETAAVHALRTSVSQHLPGVRVGALRLAPAASAPAAAPAVPPPPAALPPGPLRIDAEFESTPHAPLTTMAELLRVTLMAASGRELGLRVTAVDLLITDLLESGNGHDGDGSRQALRGAGRAAGGPGGRAEAGGPGRSGEAEHPPAPADDPRAAAAAQAVIAVPGVSRLAPVLGPPLGGGPAGAVDVTDEAGPDGRPEGRHLRIQLAVAEGARALDVAQAVRRAAAKAAAWDAEEPQLPVSVAVLVTAIDPPAAPGR